MMLLCSSYRKDGPDLPEKPLYSIRNNLMFSPSLVMSPSPVFPKLVPPVTGTSCLHCISAGKSPSGCSYISVKELYLSFRAHHKGLA